MSQTITIEVSDELYSKLQRTAQLTQQPVNRIVEQSLSHSIPPLVEEIPPIYQPDVFPLLKMSDTELLAEAQRRLPDEQWTDYEALLAKKKEEPLSQQEQARLDTLHREADVLMFRKGYAALLLKRRGYRLPPLTELSQQG